MVRGGDSGTRTTSRIFRAIWRNPGISRIDIAKLLELDKSTVTNQVGFLMDAGLVEEKDEGEASSKGGRKPIRLAVRKEYGRFIGIEVQVGLCEAVVVDASGAVLASERSPVEIEYDNFADTIVNMVEETESAYCGDSILLGVGVGTAGLVDTYRNRIRYSVPLGIAKPFDFAAATEGKILVPHCIDNDANCCAWGELAFNRKEELKDFLYALVECRQDQTSLRCYGGIGVGFGIVLGGKVHTGSHGYAGEFRSVLCEGKNDLQFSLGKEELKAMRSDKVILERAIEELARNMAMLINTMDFPKVFIGGDIEGLDVDLPAMLRRKLEENWMYPTSKKVDIDYSSLKDKAVAYGAAGMVFERLMAQHRPLGLDPQFGFTAGRQTAAAKA
ncbi:MAG: ROK family transcriptional regulator [Spirochaetes bacterium]|nr:ROK family transcriptional regulator [Spirochaetota bacterium]